MSQQDYTWRGAWEESGVQVNDGNTVPMHVGVIEVNGKLSVAIGVASGPPGDDH